MEKDERKNAIVEVLTKMGINPYDKEINLNYEQVLELRKTLKEEYDIEVNIKQSDEFEELRTSMKEFILDKKPAMEICGTPPDGKARRRERRRLERLQNKRRR